MDAIEKKYIKMVKGSISIAVSYYYYDNTPSYIIEELPVIIETFPNEF